MSEWGLISLLAVTGLIAALVIVYPLRKNRAVCCSLFGLILLVTSFGYANWGSFNAWRDHHQQQQKQEVARQILKTMKSPQELINKLRAKLDNSPASAKGWYLLGKLYVNQNDNQQALKAFAKAYQFKPEEEEFAVHYAHAVWQANNQQFNDTIRTIFKELLKSNPQQPDALAMLAMDAYQAKAYPDAITYWERLLKIAPAGSDEAKAIRKAIAKAQSN